MRHARRADEQDAGMGASLLLDPRTVVTAVLWFLSGQAVAFGCAGAGLSALPRGFEAPLPPAAVVPPCAAHAGNRTAARDPWEYTQVHMGLPVRILLYAADERQARAAATAAFARIAILDHVMSDYRDDSELRRLERERSDWVTVSDELFTVLARAREIARLTDGAFDPTVGPVVALWRDARRKGRLPDPVELDAARSRVGWRHIALDPRRRAIRLILTGMQLDLGGIAKGYILQDALRTLRAIGVTRALVESGGDIVVGAAPPGRHGWRIDTPSADEAFSRVASCLVDSALATSGATAQFLEIDGVRYSHVIDPRTGIGLTHHVVARVIADDAATADALATALTVVGPTRAVELLNRFPGVRASLADEGQSSLD